LPTEQGHFKRWRTPEAGASDEAAAFGRTVGLQTLAGTLLWRRGIRDETAGQRFLDPKLTHLHDPALLRGAARAATRIVEAVRAKQDIVVYGDYDVDGITASAILYHTLRALGDDVKVRCYVPHRIEEGYGLNSEAIAKLADEGAQLIVSVDCGITAIEQAAIARSRGVDLIITDHHEMAAALPDAHTLVHPQLPGENGERYPFPDLCGAGVAYKLAWQVARTWCGGDKVSGALRTLLVDLLSLAALGTIADVVPLVGENRAIAMFGLRRVKQTPLVGLNALIDASSLRDEKIDSYHVGFVLGPRLNACGRMGHAKEAVKLLTEATPGEAAEIAEFLTAENNRRRDTERRIFEQARAMVRELGFHLPGVRAIVLGHAEWHAGVVGIVCSRLVEEFGRPTVLLSTTNGHAHGSARSIDGFSIHEAFGACADHLESFGGHAMAAGLRLATGKIPAFREAMIGYAAERLTEADLVPLLQIDCETPLAELSPLAVDQVRRLAPFGRSNPSPVVVIRGAKLSQAATPMGQTGQHMSMLVRQDGGAPIRCIGWKMSALVSKLPAGVTVDIAAEPTLNHWNGRTNVELVIKDLRWV
jgi:single-stranded-DNA-specific exonuclease